MTREQKDLLINDLCAINSDRWLSIENLPNEEWKPIIGHGDRYSVSNYGRIKTDAVTYAIHGHIKTNPAHILRVVIRKDGYCKVSLGRNKKQKTLNLHRLVAIAFIPNPNNLPCINHKDENPSNNCVDNLEWCTQQYNVTYGSAIQKRIKSNSKVKSVVMLNLNGEVEMEFESSADAAQYVGGNSSNVWAVCNKRAKTYKGKVFVYKDEWLIKEGYFNKEYLDE